MAYRSMNLLALALFGLLNSRTAFASDKTLLSEINKIFTVWSDATSCTAQSQSDVDPDPARVGCIQGLTQVQAGNKSSITVYWRGANMTGGATPSPEVAATLANVTKVTVKACFSALSTKDRKWRKKKDEIGKDKQCFKKLKEDETWPQDAHDASQVLSYTWEVADNTGKATYFFRVFGYDAQGNTIGYGDSDVLLEEPFTHGNMTIGTAEGTHGIGYWKVKGFDGLTSGVVTGVVILSILSWVLLISYFVYEHYIQKDD
uniref:High-affinity nitrate transporter n=1 Tax=Pyramimonas obovata TaxID=1411642 RepID=A0A7S0MVD7_9CHLO